MKYIGSCHCKNIEFEVETDLEKIVQCNCSICIRRNAKMIIVPKENFILIKGERDLSLYQFNSNVAKHYFCKKCGIYTHHRSYTNPENYEYNVGCIDNVDTFEYKNIPVFDGDKL